jgi:hypothetical protein
MRYRHPRVIVAAGVGFRRRIYSCDARLKHMPSMTSNTALPRAHPRDAARVKALLS